MKKVVLVTGASSGIGEAIASYLNDRGYIVYGASRTAPSTDKYSPIKLDVTDEESIAKAIKEIISQEGKIDVLINNAGVGSVGVIENTPIDDVKKSFEVNFFGVLRMCQAVLPYMRQQHFGRIINTSTLGSMIGLPFRAFYSASKGSMDLMTEALRLEVDRFGIQACTIHPGEVKTNIGLHRVVSASAEDKVYGPVVKKAMDKLDEAMKHGKNPAIFGPLIEKIINAKKIKRNYYLGNFNELLGIRLKKLLPYYLYERILKSYFKSE